jgi:hypothetical protein
MRHAKHALEAKFCVSVASEAVTKYLKIVMTGLALPVVLSAHRKKAYLTMTLKLWRCRPRLARVKNS